MVHYVISPLLPFTRWHPSSTAGRPKYFFKDIFSLTCIFRTCNFRTCFFRTCTKMVRYDVSRVTKWNVTIRTIKRLLSKGWISEKLHTTDILTTRCVSISTNQRLVSCREVKIWMEHTRRLSVIRAGDSRQGIGAKMLYHCAKWFYFESLLNVNDWIWIRFTFRFHNLRCMSSKIGQKIK